MPRTTCPECGEEFRISPGDSREPLRCPACGHTRPRRRKKKRAAGGFALQRWHLVAGGAGALVLLVVVILGIWLGLGRRGRGGGAASGPGGEDSAGRDFVV